jgi:hypothetical protein
MLHIHTPIEFEKIVDTDWDGAVNLTRERMSIQQLLDARDNIPLTIVRLKKYCESFDKLFSHIIQHQWTPLLKQPTFTWSIDGSIISSTAWNFEKNNIHIALADIYIQEGYKKIDEQLYKEASQYWKQAAEHFTLANSSLGSWKWRLTSENIYVTQQKWQKAQIEKLKCLQQLCTIGVGIGKNSSDKTLYTLAQRATKCAALEQVYYPSDTSLLHICETLRYFYSSNIQWTKEEYGASIDTLQRWVRAKHSKFQIINEEFDKLELLLSERKMSNDNIYFEQVKPSKSLPSLREIIESEDDISHP